MSLFNWITGKIRPPAADEPPAPSRIEVLALSGEELNSNTALPLSVTGSSPSSSVPIRSKPAIEEDATKATVFYAPHASGSHSSFTSATNISQRESRARNIDLARAGESLPLSSPARNSNLNPLTLYPSLPTSATTTRTTTTALVGGDPVSRNEFNGFKKKLESQLQEANTRTQEAYRQLWEQEQRHKSERLKWLQQFSSMEEPSSSRLSKSVQQQISPHEGQEPSLRVNTRCDKNLGASQEGDLSLSSPIGLPFKLRKLSTELVLGRAEVCMILREWSEMEKRSREAMAMASNLNHEPLTARCWFFLGVACYHLKKWALASDSFEFAKPCIGVYTTAHEFRSWKQKADSAIGASPAGSIESVSNSPSCKRGRSAYNRGWEDLRSISSSSSTINTPLVHSIEHVSNTGSMISESPWSGRSTPESTGDPASTSKDLPLPHKCLLRPRYKKVLSRTLTTTSIPAHRDRVSSPDPSTSIKSSREFSRTSDSYRSVCRLPLLPPGSQSGSSSLDMNGSEIAIEYLGRDTPPQPRKYGLPLAIVTPDIDCSVRPRQSRLYTPGDDHVYPRSPLRQGPRLRLIIPVKTFPGPGPIFSIPLRPSRIYMPDKPDVALYPQKPFRRGERLKVAIPSPEPQTPPLEISRPPATNKLLGYHTLSTSSSAGCSPVQPQRPPSPRRLQGRQVFPKARLSTTSSFGKLPSCPSNPSLPFSRFSYREASQMFGESSDDVSQFIRELSQPDYTKHRPVNNRTSSRSDRTSIEPGISPKEHSRHTYNSAVPSGLRVIKRTSSTPESSPGKPPPIPKRSGLRVVNHTPSTSESSPEKPPPRLRVVNRSSSTPESSPERPPPRLRVVNRSSSTPESSPEKPLPRLRVVNRSSSTPESSPGKPPPIPRRPGLRVVNRTPSTSGSSPEKPPPHLRVVNRSSSTPESSPERPPRRLRVVNRSFSTPENSPEKPPVPNRLRPQNVNRNSSTPESSLDDSSREHAQDSVLPGRATFTPSEGGSMSKGVAVWFPDTGSGCARFLDSPEDNPDGLFITELTNQYEVEYDDSRKGVPIEIGIIDPAQASTRPDVRQMVWRAPSRDSIQPHGKGMDKKNDSRDEC
ncbi:hypothetical protein MMC29_000812 [Sticta canariensis]|nr:hypothetical protein [Sticta canariensis]